MQWNSDLKTNFRECKGEEKVTQPPGDVILTQGQTATLKCTFSSLNKYSVLYWYKQEVNSYPKFILNYYRGEVYNSPEFVKDRFDAELKDSSVPLMIQDLHVCDSAVYYYTSYPAPSSGDTRFNSTLLGHFCSLIEEIRLCSGA
uniref:Immunoglobulin V-set domain-containing protein n=1 Tax=Gouania willdenowi TaxID=441366 RepID=A0A8C5DBB4_GOUWI